MWLRFWGVRGSIAVPGKETVRYGGNTTCIEVCSTSGDRIILDGGTGIRALGQSLVPQMPFECNVFITHTHWDHIQGLPFFIPLFVPGNRIILHGPPDPVNMRGMESVLECQMAYPHFPVRKTELQAEIVYSTLTEGRSVQIGDLVVSCILMNHPALNFGYRIEDRAGEQSMFFTGDHEMLSNIYSPDEDGYAEYQETVDTRNAHLESFVAGVDLLVADAQYTDAEYPSRKGWGHSSISQAVAFGRRVGVPRLILTHHETTRTDDELDLILNSVRMEHAASGIEFSIAREGECIELG